MKPPPVIYRSTHDGLTDAQRAARKRPLTKTKAEREAARARLRAKRAT